MYARAMSSFALLQGLTGTRYDAREKKLYIEPRIAGDFSALICTESGYGRAGVRNGEAFYEMERGELNVEKIMYRPFAG